MAYALLTAVLMLSSTRPGVGYARLPEGHHGWTVAEVLAAAEDQRTKRGGPVLVGFDAPIGVPSSYWEAFHRATAPDAEPVTSFLEWLMARSTESGFFEPAAELTQWSVQRPFFHVPPHGRSAFAAHLAAHGIEGRRKIDQLANANPVFIASGIAGAVGSSAIDLWQGLGTALRERGRAFGVWPFNRGLADPLPDEIIVAEIYPRLAYALAACADRPCEQQALAVSKVDPETRAEFLETLLAADAWPNRLGLQIEHVNLAFASEDAFDALVTATALLRCLLEEVPLSDPDYEDPVEGGILGSGGVRLKGSATTYRPKRQTGWHWPGSRGHARLNMGRKRVRAPDSSTPATSASRPVDPSQRVLPCPIPSCTHEFKGSRGGWDAHVASVGRHLEWHSDVIDPEERKLLFRREFGAFFE